MEWKKYVPLYAVLVAVVVLLWYVIPPNQVFRSQVDVVYSFLLEVLRTAYTYLLIAIVALIWLVEAVIAIALPGFLGWKRPVTFLNNIFNPGKKMNVVQSVLLHFILTVIAFLIGIIMAAIVTWLPPIASWYIGPFVSERLDLYMVWFGVYAAIVYLVCYVIASVDWSTA